MKYQPITIGARYGRLVILSLAGLNKYKQGLVLAACDCGKFHTAIKQCVLSGRTRSCGCLLSDSTRERAFIDGRTDSPEYSAYWNARSRCERSNHPSWRNYGGRGIKFLFGSFEEFFAAIGSRPSDQHSLDRTDNEGHYESGNVRWATRIEQNNNMRRNVARRAAEV